VPLPRRFGAAALLLIPRQFQNNRRGGSTARIIGSFGDAPELLAGQSSAGFDKVTGSEDEIKGSPATPGRSLQSKPTLMDI
jgi:hypothetical protein